MKNSKLERNKTKQKKKKSYLGSFAANVKRHYLLMFFHFQTYPNSLAQHHQTTNTVTIFKFIYATERAFNRVKVGLTQRLIGDQKS